MRRRWLWGALAVPVVAALVVAPDATDDHVEAWCRAYREFGEVAAEAGDEDPFVDPSPEVVRLAAELGELGFPRHLAAEEQVIAAGPVAAFGEDRERYDAAIDELEAFVAQECDLDPETLAPTSSG